jgi:uncharacterized membrane protein YjjP (DUF1212 family)
MEKNAQLKIENTAQLETEHTAELETERKANLAIEIGASLLECGAEVKRAEASVEKISEALGARRCDVFTLVSFILLTYEEGEGKSCTKLRHVKYRDTDFSRFERLNSLSREICKRTMTLDECEDGFVLANKKTTVKTASLYLQSITVAFCFALFFGGGIRDAIASAISANVVQLMITRAARKIGNRVIFVCTTSFLAGLACFILVKLGIGENYDTVAIGNIMLLVPGLSMIGSARDFISGDMLSGIIRFAETILTALSIAIGFALPSTFV